MLPVIYRPPAEKYFRKIKDKKLKKEFLVAINAIRTNPEIGSVKIGDLANIRCFKELKNYLKHTRSE